MRRENISEYRTPSNDVFASVVRPFREANSRFQALAVESVRRAVEIQSQFVGKTYDTYISEMSKLGRLLFVGYRTFTEGPQELTDRQQAALAGASPHVARRRTAAQSLTTKRKTGPLAKRGSGPKGSTKAKRKVGSVRRAKG